MARWGLSSSSSSGSRGRCSSSGSSGSRGRCSGSSGGRTAGGPGAAAPAPCAVGASSRRPRCSQRCPLPGPRQQRHQPRCRWQHLPRPAPTCAKISHLVGGLGLGMGFSRGSTVVGAGSDATRPTGAASEGSANRRAASVWKIDCARVWQAASVPAANAAGSGALASQAVRLPRSNVSGPSCASLHDGAIAGERNSGACRRRRQAAAGGGGGRRRACMLQSRCRRMHRVVDVKGPGGRLGRASSGHAVWCAAAQRSAALAHPSCRPKSSDVTLTASTSAIAPLRARTKGGTRAFSAPCQPLHEA